MSVKPFPRLKRPLPVQSIAKKATAVKPAPPAEKPVAKAPPPAKRPLAPPLQDLADTLRSRAGNYVIVRERLIQHLQGDCTAVLVYAFIANVLQQQLSDRRLSDEMLANDLFFICSYPYIEHKLHLARDIVEGTVQKLVGLGLVEVRLGPGRNEMMRLTPDKLRAAINAATNFKPVAANEPGA